MRHGGFRNSVAQRNSFQVEVGRGVHLMVSILDDVKFYSGPYGTVVVGELRVG